MTGYFIFAIIACLAVQALALDEGVNKQACIRDVEVNPSLVDKAYTGEISDARELKCFFKCYYQNAGYMNSKGEIMADKLKANIPKGTDKNTATKAIELCKGHKGKDACETAYLTQKCLLNNNVKY